MAPIVDRTTDPATAVTRPVVRARRRGPTPLEQIPAWRELVPVDGPGRRQGRAAARMERCSAASIRTSFAP